MMTRAKIILARGLPGSGRSTAINELRKHYPGMVSVDADPLAQGEDYSDPDNHRQALSQAAADIELYVKHGIKVIAVETSTPSSEEVRKLISPAITANYALEITDFAINEPFDVMSYVRNSSRNPDPGFLYSLVSNWEEFTYPVSDPSLDKDRAREGVRRKEAWTAYSQALGAISEDQAELLVDRVFNEYPEEAKILMLASGPRWGRLNLATKPPIFPLAEYSSYWKEIENEALGINVEGFGYAKRPLPNQIAQAPNLER